MYRPLMPTLATISLASGLDNALACINTNAPAPTAAAILSARATLQTRTSICGYLTGDPSKGWAAPQGYDCRVDTVHGLWGFCPTTVIAATDCGLGGYCFDDNNCKGGCGRLSNNPSITTWTCTPNDPNARFCSFAFLTFGVDQTYDYFHCGPDPGTVHYLAVPTVDLVVTTTASLTTSTSESSTATSQSTATSESASPTGSPRVSDSAAAPGPSATPVPVSNSTGNNLGAIVGGILGGLAIISGCIVAVVYIRRNKARRQHSNSPTENYVQTAQNPQGSYKNGGTFPSELAPAEAREAAELPA